MRVSELFSLGKTQPELDFVDVDVEGDTPVFISPRAITQFQSEWGDECVHLIQDFFKEVIRLIKNGEDDKAHALLSVLREPNETHLGLSKDKSRGRAVGNESAHDIWNALKESRATKSGLLEDLEDTVLMIEGVSVDIVSDIATNIIRAPLIQYTQQMCDWYGIPTQPEVDSGPLWDSSKKAWTSKFVRLPVAAGIRLLLVPKGIVRRHLNYDVNEYYQHYILTHLQQVEIDANSGLVQLLKNKKKRVTKKSLKEKYGTGKQAVVRETIKYPEVLAQYKKAKKKEQHPALTLEDIAEIEKQPTPDWDALLNKVISLSTGKDAADAYEKAVEGLLTALLYPMLAYPVPQQEIHEGRKRIDIAYTNMADSGFFHWAATHYPASHIFFECKNYGREIGNPELDQLAGRFSPSRGKVGFIVCRNFEDKELFMKRCRDTAKDDRGFIIPIDDGDLKALVESKKTDPLYDRLMLFQERFSQLVS
ncbi:MAG TPA: hypothetical protein VHD55_03200 [Candidatus Paceibacterota bacterium]|nr:hypothetical protein [Candidatus Paceibacterota bacterium]